MYELDQSLDHGPSRYEMINFSRQQESRFSLLFSTVAAPVCIPTNSALGFPFHFDDGVFSCVEAFQFDVVPFVYLFIYLISLALRDI